MIVLINPSLVVQRSDPFTTGIVYMPVGLAYVAAALRRADIPVKVIDAFGERPRQASPEGKFLALGLTYSEVVERIPTNARAVFLYAINLTNHLTTLSILRAIKRTYPGLPVVILENTQAVTAYALRFVAPEFYENGADYILTGEAEHRGVKLAQSLMIGKSGNGLGELDGLGSSDFFNAPLTNIRELDDLAFPAWDLFPLENYWNLRFAHGPQGKDRYLPLLTSRGCPYPCEFCVVPATNNQKWRARSAENVVDEIE
ncbi:MAG: hypothetical protein M3R52_03475, partial [Acidobacteriota bacterium]|nr:hypothetical protein [Acidobacteriota bacterium]